MQKIFSAPKLLIVISAVVLAFSLFSIAINFQLVGIFRLLLTITLLYKTLTGSRIASYILSLCLFLGGCLLVYEIYFFTFAFGFSLESFKDDLFLTKAVPLLGGLLLGSIFSFVGFSYILFSKKIKQFYGVNVSA